MTSETGPAGYTTTYTYDGKGNQLTRTNTLGEIDRYTYNTLSQLLTSTNALGYTTSYTYDARGNVLSKRDAAGNLTTYTYDALGRNKSIVEGANDITEFEYDTAGNQRLKRQRLATGVAYETTYTYDTNGNALTETRSQTTPNGVRLLTTTKTYDKNGKVTTVTDAENGLTQYEYDANGNQTRVIDPMGRRTWMRYDDKNQLIETILDDNTPSLSDNPRLRNEYDAAGNKTALVDQYGRRTGYSYDALKRPTGMILPDDTPETDLDNPQVSVTYNALGWMTALVKDGVRTEFEYDAAGRMTQSRQQQTGQAFNTTTVFDKAGRAIAKTDALNQTTRYVYDGLDRVTETVFADGNRTRTTYNAFGNVKTSTDQMGRTTTYEYDALDRLTAVVDAKLNRTEYGYDEAGNLVLQKDANGNITRYEYDGLNRRTATVRPLGQRSTSIYDGGGRVLQTTDFNGETITYRYTMQNQLTAKHFDDNRLTTFETAADGRSRLETDERGQTFYTYDAQGRLLSRTEPDGRAIDYTYDPLTGKVATVATPSGTTTYGYNSLGQLQTVSSAEGTTTYAYNAVGNLSQQTLPNGVTETYQYDLLNRLKVLETKNASGTVLSRYSYTYDAVGNKTTVQELGGRSLTYTYDELYRLTKEAIDLPGTVNDRTFEYSYDKVGNRQWKKDTAIGQTNYSYNNNDWLLSETTGGQTTTYTYDNNGNTLTKTQGSNSTIYTWDAENRLSRATITTAGGTQQLGYRYDAAGTRVAAIVDGVETRYLVDVNRPYAQVLEEYSPTGTLQARYVYGGDLDLISQTRGTTTSFYLNDGHSGVRQLMNRTGAVTDTYTYDAYGTLLTSTGNTQNDYRYRGEQTDANLGLQYLRARYYDQRTGRLASVDPFEGRQEEPVSRHRYLYSNNNPITYSDPSGQVSSVAGFGGLLGVAISNVLAQIATPLLISSAIVTGGIAIGAGISEIRRRYREGNRWSGTINFGEAGALGVDLGGGIARVNSECVNGFVTYGKYLVFGGGSSIASLSSNPLGKIKIPAKTSLSVELSTPQKFGTNVNVLAGSFGFLDLKFLSLNDFPSRSSTPSFRSTIFAGVNMGTGLGFAAGNKEISGAGAFRALFRPFDAGLLGGMSIPLPNSNPYAPCSNLPE